MKIGISEVYSYLRMAGIAVLAAGLIGCGGGGGDSDGGSSIPTASNAAITPPSTDPLTITTGAPAAPTNQTIAAAAFQTVDGGGLPTTGNLFGVFSVDATPAVSETTRLTIAEIVRRHAEKIKDHKSSASVTGALIVNTIPCPVGGTYTIVFDDVSGNASEIFVHCNDGGVISHGTISSTGISANFTPGATVGSTYTAYVAATITIDLSITSTFNPAEVLVSQGAFNFRVDFSGIMVDDGTGSGGIVPGFPTHIATHIFGTSLLGFDGVHSEKLSNFDLTVTHDDATGTTVDSHYTYANSVINGAVTVNTTTPIHYAPFASHPDAGVIEITSSASPGKKIIVTILNGVPSTSPSVQVDVYANAIDPPETYLLTWAQFEALM